MSEQQIKNNIYLQTPTLLQYREPIEITEDIQSSISKLNKMGANISTPEKVSSSVAKEDGELKMSKTEVLNKMFSPIEWEEVGRKFVQYVSPTPATREKAHDLFNALEYRMKERRAKQKGICPIREELYSQCFDEIIRQVTIECPERGWLLLKVRDEIKMTIASYQTLYESSIWYGIRKQLQCELEKVELQNKMDEVEKMKIELTNKRNWLAIKLKAVQTQIKERNEIESKKREEEKQFLIDQSSDLEKMIVSLENNKLQQ